MFPGHAMSTLPALSPLPVTWNARRLYPPNLSFLLSLGECSCIGKNAERNCIVCNLSFPSLRCRQSFSIWSNLDFNSEGRFRVRIEETWVCVQHSVKGLQQHKSPAAEKCDSWSRDAAIPLSCRHSENPGKTLEKSVSLKIKVSVRTNYDGEFDENRSTSSSELDSPDALTVRSGVKSRNTRLAERACFAIPFSCYGNRAREERETCAENWKRTPACLLGLQFETRARIDDSSRRSR